MMLTVPKKNRNSRKLEMLLTSTAVGDGTVAASEHLTSWGVLSRKQSG